MWKQAGFSGTSDTVSSESFEEPMTGTYQIVPDFHDDTFCMISTTHVYVTRFQDVAETHACLFLLA